ncbi:transcriptional repressor [Chloroflexota bacterium]
MSRKSKQKEVVLEVVKKAHSHPTANWVYEQVKQAIPNISLGTVYRNLKSLKQEGEIQELNFNGAMSRFDGITRNHYHFRCERCGCIFDLDEPVDETLNDRIVQRTDFEVVDHHLEFYGQCQDCLSRS